MSDDLALARAMARSARMDTTARRAVVGWWFGLLVGVVSSGFLAFQIGRAHPLLVPAGVAFVGVVAGTTGLVLRRAGVERRHRSKVHVAVRTAFLAASSGTDDLVQ